MTKKLPTYCKYVILNLKVKKLNLKEKRYIFNCIRKYNVDANYFIPRFGFTIGEFCCFQILNDNSRRNK